ncbi:MAG: DUF4199 domain-containing protein [Flavobacterium sp.]|nr:DUF4199 domain-containing protein [Candidatus Neoflavobacterium equi]
MNKIPHIAKWAIRFTFAGVFWSYLENFLGYHNENIQNYFTFSMLFGLIYFIFYYLMLNDINKSFYDSKISYKSAFISSSIFTLVITFLSPLPQLIMHNYIAPDFFANGIALSALKAPEKQELAKTFYTLSNFIMQGILNSFSLGILFSAAMPLLFVKKTTK